MRYSYTSIRVWEQTSAGRGPWARWAICLTHVAMAMHAINSTDRSCLFCIDQISIVCCKSDPGKFFM